MNATSQGLAPQACMDEGQGSWQHEQRNLSDVHRSAVHGAVFLGLPSCPADQGSGQSCRYRHAQRTVPRSNPEEAPTSISDMDRSC